MFDYHYPIDLSTFLFLVQIKSKNKLCISLDILMTELLGRSKGFHDKITTHNVPSKERNMAGDTSCGYQFGDSAEDCLSWLS